MRIRSRSVKRIANYDPVFSRNRALSVIPRFADEKNSRFPFERGQSFAVGRHCDHRRGVGFHRRACGSWRIRDRGLETSARPGRCGQATRAGGRFRGGRQGRQRANADMPHALALEAALLRAAFDEQAAAAVLARMGSPGRRAT